MDRLYQGRLIRGWRTDLRDPCARSRGCAFKDQPVETVVIDNLYRIKRAVLLEIRIREGVCVHGVRIVKNCSGQIKHVPAGYGPEYEALDRITQGVRRHVRQLNLVLTRSELRRGHNVRGPAPYAPSVLKHDPVPVSAKRCEITTLIVPSGGGGRCNHVWGSTGGINAGQGFLEPKRHLIHDVQFGPCARTGRVSAVSGGPIERECVVTDLCHCESAIGCRVPLNVADSHPVIVFQPMPIRRNLDQDAIAAHAANRSGAHNPGKVRLNVFQYPVNLNGKAPAVPQGLPNLAVRVVHLDRCLWQQRFQEIKVGNDPEGVVVEIDRQGFIIKRSVRVRQVPAADFSDGNQVVADNAEMVHLPGYGNRISPKFVSIIQAGLKLSRGPVTIVDAGEIRYNNVGMIPKHHAKLFGGK